MFLYDDILDTDGEAANSFAGRVVNSVGDDGLDTRRTQHANWGVEALRTGEFTPPPLVGPVPFAELQAMIGKAETTLAAFTRDEVDSWAGKELDLQIGPRRLAFTSEIFILSFSLPNFHFHAVTAYDILRSRGVPIGKRDYEGQLRVSAAQIQSALTNKR